QHLSKIFGDRDPRTVERVTPPPRLAHAARNRSQAARLFCPGQTFWNRCDDLIGRRTAACLCRQRAATQTQTRVREVQKNTYASQHHERAAIASIGESSPVVGAG